MTRVTSKELTTMIELRHGQLGDWPKEIRPLLNRVPSRSSKKISVEVSQVRLGYRPALTKRARRMAKKRFKKLPHVG